MDQGIYTMPEDQYHADPCDAPSLSSSIAGIIWHRTPLHGWMAHPKNPNRIERGGSSTFDTGTAAHALILENDMSKFCVIEADDWRTNAAKEQRDQAREEGKTPILAKQLADLTAMASAAQAAVAQSEIAGIFQDGKPEQTILAFDGIWIRGRLDWLTTDRKIILDYKTVSRSAAPESFLRSSVFNFGYDIQAAMYTLLNQLTGGPEDAKFLWLVQETEPPFACSILGAAPSLIESGRRKLDHCMNLWGACLDSGIWPGYGNRISWLEAPAWEIMKIEDREMMEEEQ